MHFLQDTMHRLEQMYSSLRGLESFVGAGGATDGKEAPPRPIQQDNSDMIRRVHDKLLGKDDGIDHMMSVAEQVSYTIEQATSEDHLALMYEGWTSWV
ncbi:hypothetical protein BC940DRAFT_304843 [Gongronella butleri]|nr:hypothetical protein BC940DRAFT_304843 [Gongronella butleri]